jgi:hypothetical protein
MAARTSASATISTGLGGGAGWAGAVSGAGAGEARVQGATAPEPVSQPNPLLESVGPRRARKRSTTWAETFGTTEDETKEDTGRGGAAHDGPFTGVEATGMPRAARNRSTTFSTAEDAGRGTRVTGAAMVPFRAARYRSTVFETTADTGWAARATGAATFRSARYRSTMFET